MARVQGIIASGLASAALPSEVNRRATEQSERDATIVREAVNERIARARATRGGTGKTGDTLKSVVGGLGAASVFGGPAGLLVFGVSKFLADKRREGIAAYTAQAAENAEEVLGRAKSAIDELESFATTDQERAEAKMIRSQFDQAVALSQNPDPDVAGQALIAAQNIAGTLEPEMDEWQAERLATQDRERERLASQFSDFDNVRGDLVRESATFIRAREAWQGAQALIRNPSPTNDIALIYKMANINDPGAIVTEGDVQVIKSTGSVTEQMAAFYNSVLRGESELSDPQRDGLIATIDTLYREQRNAQIDRNEEFQEIGKARQFDQAYQDRLRIPIDPKEATALARTANWRPSPGDSTPVPDSMSTRANDLEIAEPGILARTVESASSYWTGVAQDVGRQVSGETAVRDPETDTWYIRDRDGNLRTPGPDFVPPTTSRQSFNQQTSGGEEPVPWYRRIPPQSEPGLFQEGGFFDRRKQREVNE